MSVVERSTQAYFVDIDGYVDEHLQEELLEIIPETSEVTTSATKAIDRTPEMYYKKYPFAVHLKMEVHMKMMLKNR